MASSGNSQCWLGFDASEAALTGIRFHRTNGVCRILSVTLVAVALFMMNACTITRYQAHESQALRSPQSNINQIAGNDYLNQCGEQTRLLRHEIASCSAIPLIVVPLQ
jgi:hypothetical protein